MLPAQAVVRNAANEQVAWVKSGAERYIPQPVSVRTLGTRQRWSSCKARARTTASWSKVSLLAQIR